MFITLKARKTRAKGEMEQVATKDASTGHAIPQNLSTKRRPACVACHNRKLRCTGSVACCDRCKSRRITCVSVKKPSPTDAPGNTRRSRTSSNDLRAESTEVLHSDHIDPGLTEPSMTPDAGPYMVANDSNSREIMQQLMGGIEMQHNATPPSTAPSTAPSTTGPSNSCSCTQNVVQVLSNIEEDQFRLTQLSLDQVIQLQKWLMYQCFTALECPRCHRERAVQTILVLICERILLMYECSATRIAKAAQVPSTESTEASPAKSNDDHAGHSPPDEIGKLFCGVSGAPMETAACAGGIYSPELGSQYSIEEQVCMVHALMKLHMKSFRGLLDWIGGTCEESGNEARRGRIEALGARLLKAGESIDASADLVIKRS